MELVTATAYAASRPRAKVPGVYTEKSRGLKEYEAPFSLMLLAKELRFLSRGTHSMIRMKDLDGKSEWGRLLEPKQYLC